MTDTPAQRAIATVRERHGQHDKDLVRYCEYDLQPYPCDALRLADALEQAVSTLVALRDLSVDASDQRYIDMRLRTIDAALADEEGE